MAWDTLVKQYATYISFGAHILAAAFIFGANAVEKNVIEIAGYNVKWGWWIFCLLLALSLYVYHKTSKSNEVKQKTIDDLNRELELVKREVKKKITKNLNHVEDLPSLDDYEFK